MREALFVAVSLSVAGLAFAAAGPQTPRKKPTPTTVTLSGCVQKSETSPGQFTLVDQTGIYRLTGMDVREFLGRRVQIVGGPPRKLKITGGLKPSPNVAGQAGAMDPARAATAAHDAASVRGTGPELELRVRSVAQIAGSCGQN
jgi:hypothetical protein